MKYLEIKPNKTVMSPFVRAHAPQKKFPLRWPFLFLGPKRIAPLSFGLISWQNLAVRFIHSAEFGLQLLFTSQFIKQLSNSMRKLDVCVQLLHKESQSPHSRHNNTFSPNLSLITSDFFFHLFILQGISGSSGPLGPPGPPGLPVSPSLIHFFI